MRTDDLVKQRIASLIAAGEKVLLTGDHDNGYVDDSEARGWTTQALFFIDSLIGSDSVYRTHYAESAKGYRYKEDIGGCVSILKALRQDIENGYLVELRSLIAASVFGDMIEMAEYLLSEEGYKDPAASVCGAALETGLRQILEMAGHPAKETDRLQSLNQKCLEHEVYNKIRYAEVKSWTGIRDHAAHGDYGEYDAGQVKRMIEGVRGLLSEHLR